MYFVGAWFGIKSCLCNPGSSGTWYINQSGLEFVAILLLQSPQCWDYGYIPQYLSSPSPPPPLSPSVSVFKQDLSHRAEAGCWPWSPCLHLPRAGITGLCPGHPASVCHPQLSSSVCYISVAYMSSVHSLPFSSSRSRTSLVQPSCKAAFRILDLFQLFQRIH